MSYYSCKLHTAISINYTGAFTMKLTNTLLALSAAAILMTGCGGSTGYYHKSTDENSNHTSVQNVDLRTFKIDYKDADHIIFSWDPVEGADGYAVQLGRDMLSVGYTFPYDVSEPKFNVGDKVGEGNWWIKVKANGSSQSALAEFTITADSAWIND